MGSITEDEPTNGVRRRQTGPQPVAEDEPVRVERRSRSWSDVLDPKTMLLLGVAILSGNGSRLGEVLGLAAQPAKVEAPTADPLTSHRLGQLEERVAAADKRVSWLVRNQALVMQKLRVPMSGEPPQ